MKLLMIVIVILGLFVFFIGPTVLAQKKCYDTAQNNSSEINSNMMMRGLNPQQVCESKFNVLTDLETCVQNSVGTDSISTYKGIITKFILPYIRPLTSDVEDQQAQHDASCSEFKSLMFSSPL
jgi:hypothetical protein